MQETQRWRQTLVSGNGSNICFTRRGKLDSSYPVEDSRHASDSSCTDHIETNIDAFLDFVPIQSVVRNFKGEAARIVARGYLRISIPSNKGEFQCELQKALCVPDYSSNLLSVSRCTVWGIASLLRKEIAA